MFKKIVTLMLVFALALGLAGCIERPTSGGKNPPTENTQPEDPDQGGTTEPGDENEDGEIAVLDSVQLYSSTYRRADGAAAPVSVRASTDPQYLRKGEQFYIDITLIDLFDTVEFIYTVSINGVKYRYADGDFTDTERNTGKKTVSFSVLLEYDGKTAVFSIDSIIIQNYMLVSYYAAISDEYRPVVIPTRDGSGTETDPYLVYTAEMFAEMADYPAGTYFKQANDIDLSDINTGEQMQSGQSTPLDFWKSLGTYEDPFSSHFDGNGFKIYRLSIQRFDTKYYDQPLGLFGYAENCEIKNVTLEDYRVEVRSAATVGALAGYTQNCRILNCKLIQGAKENFASGSWSFCNMGGLIGFANESLIEGCSVVSDLGLYIDCTDEYPIIGMLGGIVGELRRSTLLNCTFSGNAESGAVAGGIVGRSDESIIAGCESDAAITASTIAGGIVGQLWRSAVQYSKFFGEISYPLNQNIKIYTNGYFGGIAGDLGIADIYFDLLPIEGKSAVSTLDCCVFAGNITTDSMSGPRNTSDAGGLASRGFIGYIYNSMVQHASISGGEAYAVIANDSDLPNNISTGIVLVSDTELKGETKQSITASQSNELLFASSDLRADDPEHYTPVSDWTNLPVEAPLDPSRWKIENGCYTLIYAGLLPEDIAAIIRNLQIRDGTIFPRS